MNCFDYYNKSLEYSHNNKYQIAINNMLMAISLCPNNVKFNEEIAVLYLHVNNKEKSLYYFDKALRLEPNNAYRFASRAFARNYFNDFKGAIVDYEKAIELDPNDAITRNNLGLVQEKIGFYNSAQSHFDKSNELLNLNNSKYLSNNSNQFESCNRVNHFKDKKTNSIRNLIFKVLTDKRYFIEFFNFIKNGFKIK